MEKHAVNDHASPNKGRGAVASSALWYRFGHMPSTVRQVAKNWIFPWTRIKSKYCDGFKSHLVNDLKYSG